MSRSCYAFTRHKSMVVHWLLCWPLNQLHLYVWKSMDISSASHGLWRWCKREKEFSGIVSSYGFTRQTWCFSCFLFSGRYDAPLKQDVVFGKNHMCSLVRMIHYRCFIAWNHSSECDIAQKPVGLTCMRKLGVLSFLVIYTSVMFTNALSEYFIGMSCAFLSKRGQHMFFRAE